MPWRDVDMLLVLMAPESHRNARTHTGVVLDTGCWLHRTLALRRRCPDLSCCEYCLRAAYSICFYGDCLPRLKPRSHLTFCFAELELFGSSKSMSLTISSFSGSLFPVISMISK